MRQALLVLVSGPSAAGRSALAARIATELGVPLLTRDAIRAGMLETQSGWTVTPAADLTARATSAWRAALDGLLAAGVTVVAEHPLRAELSAADVAPLAGRARTKVVRCQLDPSTAALPPPPEPKLRALRTGGMIVERPDPKRLRRSQGGGSPGGGSSGGRRDLSAVLGVPVLTVEPKGRGYHPPLADIVWFVRQPA